MDGYDLLEKTELRLENISLEGANLNDVANAVAEVLGMKPGEVLMTDVIENVMTIDIMRKTVDPHQIVGKKDLLLKRLSEITGVGIGPETSVCSEGMLGWIALDGVQGEEALKKSEQMVAEIRQNIARRVLVFSTGEEVVSGQIEDTNQPLIAETLEAEGFVVKRGPALKDDWTYISGQLREAAETGGYILIITTGGVGAEAKDHTIEALLAVDPEAITPYISKYKIGTGRHTKEGVRIGVGVVTETLIVALPGPNDEVKISLDVLVKGLKSGLSRQELAESLAVNLRQVLREKMKHWHH